MILLVMQEDSRRTIAIVLFLAGDSQHQRVAAVLIWAFSLLVFDG